MCLTESLQALQQTRMWNVSQMEQTSDRCTERMQLIQFVICLGQLGSQSCNIVAKILFMEWKIVFCDQMISMIQQNVIICVVDLHG